MTTASVIFLVSLVAFIGYALLVTVETKAARRLVLGRLRDTIDAGLTRAAHQFENHWKHISRYVLQLGWYYSVHRVLRTILGSLVLVYTFFETIFEKNRQRTKELRKEFKRQLHKKTHLSQIAEHKEETLLSPEEQEALKAKKLEQDH